MKVELDARYSSEGAEAVEWDVTRERLAAAETYWLSTVRPDGRPHVTPLIAVWMDDALYFSTGAEERKARNLDENPNCVMTTGCNRMGDGLDIVVEGRAARVRDEERLRRLAAAHVEKYGEDWSYSVQDGDFVHEGHVARVYEIVPATVFGFGKGGFSQTRYRFQ
ncbi:pyridoxamine 5'-phosphate oxidase family protein [Spirillospora albida]|uniref:pyridoxamine 5'-phosphate oxidase family protein n=1 Tax=Spirillospora albida TaxID=58123 RepID=UPI0004C04785|nr:pyridoxamine 5'-phosphate oxidase family protein [Spirillospora albida]